MISDKNGSIIRVGDTLLFDSGSKYRVVEKDGEVCIKCESCNLPLFELRKIVIGNVLVSACRKNTQND